MLQLVWQMLLLLVGSHRRLLLHEGITRSVHGGTCKAIPVEEGSLVLRILLLFLMLLLLLLLMLLLLMLQQSLIAAHG